MIKLLRRLFSFEQPPAKLQAAHNDIKSRFNYILQKDEWANKPKTLTVTLNGPINGDCDDWAATVAYICGGEYAEVRLSDTYLHAVCILDGWVSDNMVSQPYQLKHAKWAKMLRRFKLNSPLMKAYKYKLILK